MHTNPYLHTLSFYDIYFIFFIEPTLKVISGLAGKSFEGIPVYCGGDFGTSNTNECYKYLNHSWASVSILVCAFESSFVLTEY